MRATLAGVLALALLGPAPALAADSLTLTAKPSTGVPTSVVAAGSTDATQGRVSVFREPWQASGCPTTYSSAHAQGVDLSGDADHAITAAGSFSFEDQNSGTQTPGAKYQLCGYLETRAGTTVAATEPYTVPGGGPPEGTTAPTATTGDAGQNFISGTLTTGGLDTTYQFEYGTTSAYGQSIAGQGAESGTITRSIDVMASTPPLPAGTTFHYRLVATNARGSAFGGDRVATTFGGVPTVTTGPATGVGLDGFTLTGSFNPHGDRRSAYFEYQWASGTSAIRETARFGPVAEADQGSENSVSLAVPTGFDEFFGYRLPDPLPITFPTIKPASLRYRLVVDATKGEWQTVTAPKAPRPPSVTTGSAEMATCGDVGPCIRLHGTANNQAQGYAFTGFEVGPTPSYGRVCAALGGPSAAPGTAPPSSTTPYPISVIYCRHQSFAPGTTVHYRAVASNGGSAGIVYGEDRSYTVPGGGAGPALTRALAPTGAAASVGTILAAGGYPAALTAPSAGTATIAWYAQGARTAAKAKPVLVARGSKRFAAPGATEVKVKLTAAGKRLLSQVKKHRQLALVAKGTFKPEGGAKVSKQKAFKLKG